MNDTTFNQIKKMHDAMNNFNEVFKQTITTEVKEGKDQPEFYTDLLDNAEAVREATNNVIASLRQIVSTMPRGLQHP